MTDNALVPFNDIERMGTAIAKSGLFGVKSPEQAVAIMLIAQANGQHPALAAQDYDIVQGRPAKKPQAMLRDFIAGGGSVQWHASDRTQAEATFSHPQGGSIRIRWDMERAKQMGYAGKDNWKKQPDVMLRWRCVSEGVRIIYPGATSGLYEPDEVRDFTNKPVEREVHGTVVTDAPPHDAPVDTQTGEVVTDPDDEAKREYLDAIKTAKDMTALKTFYDGAINLAKDTKDAAYKKRVIAAKDARKAELEKETKEWKAAYDGKTTTTEDVPQ